MQPLKTAKLWSRIHHWKLCYSFNETLSEYLRLQSAVYKCAFCIAYTQNQGGSTHQSLYSLQGKYVLLLFLLRHSISYRFRSIRDTAKTISNIELYPELLIGIINRLLLEIDAGLSFLTKILPEALTFHNFLLRALYFHCI